MKRSILVFMVILLLVYNLQGAVDNTRVMKIPFNKLGHHILVKVKIDGSRNSYNFMVDTGGLTFIDKKIVKDLQLKQRGPMAKITSLGLSGYQINNIFCWTTFDFDPISAGCGTPIHGIIGSDLLERYKVTFDFKSDIITLSNDFTALTAKDNELYFAFKNHPVNNAPIIKLQVNQEVIEGMIDTGQPYALALPFKYFDQHIKSQNMHFIKSKGLMIKWPQTTPTHNYLARLKTCELNKLS